MTASTGADRWQRLGALLIQRRTALTPRFHNRGAFCEATGLKYRLVYDIEEARRTNFGSSTLAAIEAAYRLGPGAIARFLAGGVLESQGGSAPLAPVASAPPRRSGLFAAMPREMRAQVEPYLREVKGRAEAAADAHPDQPLKGSWVFPRDPEQARRWDVIAARGRTIYPEGFTVQEVSEALALIWALDAKQEDPGDIAAGLGRAGLVRRPVTFRSRCTESMWKSVARIISGASSKGLHVTGQGESCDVQR